MLPWHILRHIATSGHSPHGAKLSMYYATEHCYICYIYVGIVGIIKFFGPSL